MLEIDQHLSGLKKRIHRLVGTRIELVWVRGSKLDPVLGEAEWIDQTIIEMAISARSSMPYGGRLLVECCNLDLDAHAAATEGLEAGRYVMLEMTCVRQIFDPAGLDYDMVVGALSDLEEDVWLESRIVQARQILQTIGGAVCEYNEPGRALTLRAFFPSAAVVLYSDEEGFSLTDQPNKESILLVEDEGFVRDVACEILEMAGYTVVSARTAKEALAIYEKQGPFRLLLTDVVMPGMNGRDLAQRLTSIQPDLKTIYMSGYTENPVVRHDFQSPDINYLQKPFTLESLTDKVKEALESTSA